MTATVRIRSQWVAGVGALTLVGVLLRIPFLDVPVTADEGGYAEIARLWSHGQALYQGAWVDRPQGLILVFRAALGLDLGSAPALRTVAAGFAVLLVVLAALVGESAGGRRRGLIVAALVATAGASPFIEGFALNGELIASVFATAAILAFLRYSSSGHAAWLVGSGVCAGSAWMVKQSAVDAALTVGMCLALWTRPPPKIVLFAALVAVPIALGLLLSGDPGAWYGAVIGYGLHASGNGLTLHERWVLLQRSLPFAAKSIGPAAVLALFGWRRAPAVARIWLAFAVIGVLLGGGFHSHYYLQLVVPLSLLAAFVPLPDRWMAAGVAIAAALSVLFAVPLWRATDAAQARAIWPTDRHLLSDSAVAAFLRNNSRPSDKVYVLWAAADIYYLADRRPAVKYLWLRNVQTIGGAVAAVRRSLDQRDATLVVIEQAPSSVDRSGATADALFRNYRLKARVDGVAVYGLMH